MRSAVDARKTETKVQAGEQSTEKIVLELIPKKLPKLTVTDGQGVQTSRCVSLVDLLRMVDNSTVLDELAREEVTRTRVVLPPQNVVMMDILESPTDEIVCMTGWIEPALHIFTIRNTEGSWLIPLPEIVYTVMWSKGTHTMKALDIALLRDGGASLGPHTGLNSRMWRWPFSNVYTHGVGTNVCWYTMGDVKLTLREVPRLGVGGFLNVPNVPDLYGVGISQQSEHTGLAEFLSAVVNAGGLKDEWLIPHDETVGGMHERRASRY